VHLEGASTVSSSTGRSCPDLDRGSRSFAIEQITDFDLEQVRRIEIIRAGKPPIVIDGAQGPVQVISPQSHPARADRAKAIAMRFSKLLAARVVDDDRHPKSSRPQARARPISGHHPHRRRRILADIRFGKPSTPTRST